MEKKLVLFDMDGALLSATNADLGFEDLSDLEATIPTLFASDFASR